MAKVSRADFQFLPRPQPTGGSRPEAGTPRRLLVMGDFSGRPAGSTAGRLVDRQPLRIDIDSFDRVLKQLSPEIRWLGQGGSGESPSIHVGTLDDFHPDHLCRRVPMFEPLRSARRLIQRDRDSVEAVADLLRDAGLLIGESLPTDGGVSPATSRDSATSGGPEETTGRDEQLMQQLFGERPAGLQHRPPPVDISPLLQQAVEGSVVPAATERQQRVSESIERAMRQFLRFLLHAPVFQSLESIWRSVYRLVSQVEMDETIELYLLDLPKELLVADLAAESDWRGTEFYRWLREAAREPWSLVVGAYSFGQQAADIATLAMVGGIVAEGGCPFLSGADPTLVGGRSWIDIADHRDWASEEDASLQAWQKLRTSGMAPWIGLAAPRVLLRLPYGSRTDPIDTFDFEEIDSPADHGHFLWGNPGLALAELALLAWSRQQSLGEVSVIDDLPGYTFTNPQGETEMQACAEVFLSDRAAESLLGRGIMPLVSEARRNRVHLLRVQSIASPPARLANS